MTTPRKPRAPRKPAPANAPEKPVAEVQAAPTEIKAVEPAPVDAPEPVEAPADPEPAKAKEPAPIKGPYFSVVDGLPKTMIGKLEAEQRLAKMLEKAADQKTHHRIAMDGSDVIDAYFEGVEKEAKDAPRKNPAHILFEAKAERGWLDVYTTDDTPLSIKISEISGVSSVIVIVQPPTEITVTHITYGHQWWCRVFDPKANIMKLIRTGKR